ncbi:aldo/keto reductase [Streptomyces sp. NBC_01637]|uniref:aldo/keto reductase n=1 Tax=unclassified Streptomyces TaxID=2593676 RepID=UPI003863AA68|nr:aldo/keto reductase [Streptomyces sp. NBC_01653]WTC84619.1 aldo/keto reductase [Streptomyces sp. NBC_01653]WTD86249.1 aldo/keto reductase [Streptomyces sp. NBC_01637]WTD94276.1 aldo/keto reductase [Streptomyces sp. NBC_01637]
MDLKKILPDRIGFGTAPMGNMFRAVPDDEVAATLNAAWDQGIRYYDTAPLYGAGLAEIRLGGLLSQKPREEFVLSTKVGRVILDEIESGSPDLGEKGSLFEHGRPNKIVHEWTAEATERSIEGSLKRLGLDRLDIVWVHDIAQDFHGDLWLSKFEEARTGAFRVLSRMRDEGVIKAWGLGVNRTEPIELTLALDEPQPDGFLLAGRYSLLDHAHALQRLLPMAEEQGLGMVVGGPYSSGILAGGTQFEYQDAPPEIVERVKRIKEIAGRYGVGIKAAALQFSLAHPVSAAAIPGATKPSRVAEDLAALHEHVPATFWRELRENQLVSPQAPLPGGA